MASSSVPLETVVPSEDLAKIRTFIFLDTQVKNFTKQRDAVKQELMEMLIIRGEPEEGGHFYLPFDREIGPYKGLQRQRRASRGYDEDEALSILIARGLKSRCCDMVPEINQDEVMECLREGLLTESEVDRMFPIKEQFAFVPVKAE